MVHDPVHNRWIAEFADRYERIRATQPSGSERTISMEKVVTDVVSSRRDLPNDPKYATRLFACGESCSRGVALGLAQADPRPEYLDVAIDAIGDARTPFEQYHAMRLATVTLATATAEQRRALRDALVNPRGTQIRGSDPSRFDKKNDLLRMLDASRNK